jgi:hypothetical protein
MINVWDVNARASIAFSLAMIVALLVYIAFYKDSGPSKRKAKS